MMQKTSFLDAMDTWRTPERIIFVTSINENGTPHIITISWQMRVAFNPQIFAISIGQTRYMHSCIADSKEFVLAVPGESLAKAALACGKKSTRMEDRFKTYGLLTKQGESVNSPIIENCLANFECQLIAQMDAGDHTIFVGQVLHSWVNEGQGSNLLVVRDVSVYNVLAKGPPYVVGTIKEKD
jgi:flavin reductase (DIM6/NTAB) family NADH-FMN oxidoreductase RutF